MIREGLGGEGFTSETLACETLTSQALSCNDIMIY
jgi:hypothetical protein